MQACKKKTDYNAKISEIESQIPSSSGLTTTSALTAVENKIPNVGNLGKKTDYDAKSLDIESKYFSNFTTADYNKFTSRALDAKIKQRGLVHKFVITGFVNNADLDFKK